MQETTNIHSIVASIRNGTFDTTSVFIPYNLDYLVKERLRYLITAFLIILLFVYLISYAIIVDAFYYWHVDIYVVIGIFTIALFLFIGVFLLKHTINKHLLIRSIQQMNEPIFGIYLIDHLLLEIRHKDFIYFHRDQIQEIILCEKKGNDTYIELLILKDNRTKVIGFKTDQTDFDLVGWINDAIV